MGGYFSTHNREREIFQKQLAERDMEIMELRKQIESLKGINDIVVKQRSIREGTTGTGIHVGGISKEKIDEYVEKLLTDENINIKYLPDFVERQIYRNVFNLMINLLENICETTNVSLLGHQITMGIKPQQ